MGLEPPRESRKSGEDWESPLQKCGETGSAEGSKLPPIELPTPASTPLHILYNPRTNMSFKKQECYNCISQPGLNQEIFIMRFFINIRPR